MQTIPNNLIEVLTNYKNIIDLTNESILEKLDIKSIKLISEQPFAPAMIFTYTNGDFKSLRDTSELVDFITSLNQKYNGINN